MDIDYDTGLSEPKRKRPLVRLLVTLLFGFVAGMVATGYALTHWDSAAGFIKTGNLAPETQSPNARAAAPPPPQPAAAAFIGNQRAMDDRVAQLEMRINRIDARAEAAVGNADRAEGLLVAFAARRALDRGVALGYIETLLRDRFGGTQPQAVATIINASHQPVTLDQLQAGLEAAAPRLMTQTAHDSWWTGVRRELAGLVVLRRADTPSPAPEDRLARARNQLEIGHVEAALAEVARMPGSAAASAWFAMARRYASARSALDMIETAALLTPHERTSAFSEVEAAPLPEPEVAAPEGAIPEVPAAAAPAAGIN
ncbi:MAG: hypothetical protein JWM75_2831 [Sphingomonas bacterium]|nr:hypothetical protein [Sphingomonas bacterium]